MSYFSFEGRTGRKEYFKTLLFITAILFVYAILVSLEYPNRTLDFYDALNETNPEKGYTAAIFGLFILQLVAFIARSALAVKRCHDANINANVVWLTFADFIIPGTGWLVLFVIGCLPSKVEPVNNTIIQSGV
jgi:uncharacterized membrane protein YhaH (DUF805 family)